MSSKYATARAMVQQLLASKLEESEHSLPEGAIPSAVGEIVSLLGARDVDEGALIAEMEGLYQTIIGAERELVGEDDGWKPWLPKRKASIGWAFWERYRRYLVEEKAWPAATVDRMDKITDKVLGFLTDPEAEGAWDRRGMVVGHVQSGKTANYVGLVSKAADAGYKIIVVLAGFHKSLRSQTQIRLEEGFLGYDRAATLLDPENRRVPVGVGDAKRYGLGPKADSITTRADGGDFKRTLANNFAINPGGHPLLFVVKKNGSVLRNLLGWVKWVAEDKDDTGKAFIKGVPLLVIDDEADQGSIDTRKGAFDEDGNADPDHDPSVLNGLIRRLLHMFDQSAYVGYTATPFANILIHEQKETDKHGADLFPRSFIVSLPTASNYVGPAKIFGLQLEGEDDVDPLPILREVDDYADSLDLNERAGWVPPKHNEHWVPRFEGMNRVPPSLKEAIRAFVLVCAARTARGDETAHNSMLIHVTRFTNVQGRVAEQVQDELTDIQRRLRHGDGDSPDPIRGALEELWIRDFEDTHKKIRSRGLGADCERLEWEDIEPLLEKSAFSIEVRAINGAAGDVLDYLNHKETGLNVIAIGGDKLSRGLTLEGLSVSYFLRASRMYDTLMQMGRWFGYRPRFVDLCRLYTTAELIDWFGHIASASEELREDFNRMAASGGTPRDFGHRVQSHPLMLVTSAVKMRDGTKIDLTFEGDISETINFWRKRDQLERNWKAGQALVEAVETAGCIPSAGTVRKPADGVAEGHRGPWVWTNAPADAVLNFLNEYREHEASKKVKTRLLADYVQREMQKGRLTNWTIFLASGSRGDVTLGSATTSLVERAWHTTTEEEKKSLKSANHYRIRRLLNPPDEAADLTDTQHEDAFERTCKVWAEDPDKQGRVPKRPGGREIRDVRPPESGILLLYVLDGSDDDKVEEDAAEVPVLAFGISFPSVEPGKATKVQYIVNNVYWQEEFNASYNDDENEL